MTESGSESGMWTMRCPDCGLVASVPEWCKRTNAVAYAARHDAAERLKRDHATYDLADAWIGLDTLLKGAWGTENLNALGGGKAQVEKAHAVLGRLISPTVDRA